ncbi:MAG: family 20 glycosylhydrolase [Flavobacteriales bacterium]|nr:family 20 glycosylhydrolase [Flavobacteriales bacterium]
MRWNGKYWFFVASFLLIVGCDTEKSPDFPKNANYNLIPAPRNLKTGKGFFELQNNLKVYCPKQLNGELSEFGRFLKKYAGVELQVTNELEPACSIYITLWEKSQNEHYSLKVNEQNIYLAAHTPEGVARGLSTLKQLFLLNNTFVPALSISDQAEFRHRGLLLDCCRHFFDKEVIKKYIDLLAFYKMNTLHWHLTEDQAWRIAIDKYPKLTEIGAWRTEKDGKRYGGFYSKADIREIVAYAEERHITIIPEIELPGHAQAALAAYPQLSCTGEPIEVANDWGVFKDIYCAGNDSVFIFLEDVLTEVMELFPSEYVHIGGDEAPKYRWEHCPKCQKRMLDEGLHNEHELQSYFIKRIEQFLNQNGRKLIGWDEILEGGLSPHATVQSWRGIDGGLKAATESHDAIMSPTSHCYLDYDLKAIDLQKVYLFNPIPDSLPDDKQHHILGGEVNMWTEHVPDEATLDNKVFPRLLAMSEVLWTGSENRNYDEFYQRVQDHYPLLEKMGIAYGLEHHPASITTQVKNGQVYIHPVAGNNDLTLSGFWDFEFKKGQQKMASIDQELILKKTGTLYIQAYKNDLKYGEPISQGFELHAAIGKPVTYSSPYNVWYKAGGDSGLVDGKLGTLDFRDGNWQGFWGTDAEMIIDLGEEQSISSIGINCYQYNNAWIFMPTEVQFFASSNGEQFVPFEPIPGKTPPTEREKCIETFRTEFEPITLRYVKVKAKNRMKVPDWHEAAGSDAWIFMDEIYVK